MQWELVGSVNIYNIRLGFATNSSSTHSLVLLGDGHHVEDADIEETFGWNQFILASAKMKLAYVASNMNEALRNYGGKKNRHLLIAKAIGALPIDDMRRVDHQSVADLPTTWFGAGPDVEFMKALRDVILSPNIAVVGGNDNDEDFAEYVGGASCRLRVHGGVSRHDPKYNYWTVFDRDSGTKVRYDMSTPRGFVVGLDPPSKAYAPELVDLKITSRCNNDAPCRKYCYQSASRGGEHASLDTIEKYADLLCDLQVFEVALGGGEPLEHPDLIRILRAFRERGVVPSFSTRRSDWLTDEAMRRDIFDLVGAVGFSVNSVSEYNGIRELVEEEPTRKVKFQHVVGSTTRAALLEIVRSMVERQYSTRSLLLLGYKSVGNGARVAPHKFNALNFIRDHCRYGVGVDTQLVKQIGMQHLSEITSRVLITPEEGKFSCYIDPFSSTVAPSSYADPNEHRRIDPTAPNSVEAFLDTFASF